MREYFDSNSMYRGFCTYEEDSEDGEFLKSMYPRAVTELQLLIEDEGDKLEYANSAMFDQYPDKAVVSSITQRILKKYGENTGQQQKNDEGSTDLQNCKCLDILVEIMVINEIMRRRMRMRYNRARGFS